jgi:hypothetical protein
MKAPSSPEFLQVYLADLKRALELAGARELQPRDGWVLLALMAHTETFSGKIRASAIQLASDLQTDAAGIRASLSRLKKSHLVRQITNRYTQDRYYRLNPWLVRSSGDNGLLALAMKEFQDA